MQSRGNAALQLTVLSITTVNFCLHVFVCVDVIVYVKPFLKVCDVKLLLDLLTSQKCWRNGTWKSQNISDDANTNAENECSLLLCFASQLSSAPWATTSSWHSGWGLDFGWGSGSDSDSSLNPDLDLGSESDLGSGLDSDTGSGLNSDLDLGSDSAFDSDSGFDSDSNSGLGLDSDSGSDSGSAQLSLAQLHEPPRATRAWA